ncbi:MAG: hypothetical protein HY985_01955 [Magnetospirillum sp.]|nr:hypothetical protein [Magnetospirillum sp.]
MKTRPLVVALLLIAAAVTGGVVLAHPERAWAMFVDVMVRFYHYPEEDIN